MDYQAQVHSGYFRRSLGALQARAAGSFDALTTLDDWIGRKIDATLLEATLDQTLQAERARIGAMPSADAYGEGVGRVLRQVRQCLIMALAERDIRGLAPLSEVCSAMTAFAAIATRIAMRQAGAELAERHGRPLDSRGAPQDLLAVAMGKGGADELNVSSDLDLIFVFREQGETEGVAGGDGQIRASSRIATAEFMHRLARRTINLLAESTGDGFVFRVDTRLRPNGDSGPLVASLPMLEDYFFSQGREWERLAWLKGKVAADSGLAGDQACRDDTQALASIVTPFVFRRYLDFRAFGALRELHQKIHAEIARRDARNSGGIDLKLGRGGIREIEFTAQLFQIVRGGRDPGLRDRRTLVTLGALGERGILPQSDVDALRDAYELLRRAEHALQFQEDAQTHRLGHDADARERVAAMLGMPRERFESALESARTAVQRVFDDLLKASDQGELPRAGEVGDGAKPPPEALTMRLQALRDAQRYRVAAEDTRKAIETVLARAFDESEDEAALTRLIELIEAVLGRPAYIALLAQFPLAQRRVMTLLGKAKWAADYLNHHPILLDELLDGQLFEPADYASWEAALREALAGARLDGEPDIELQMDLMREAHHAQLFRLLAQDLEGLHSVERISDHLSELADRVLAITLDLVWPLIRKRHRDTPRFAVIAYGRLGGKELGYASDLDLVYLFDDDDDAAQMAYSQLGTRLGTWLSSRTAAGQLFDVDLRLRPNGDAGLIVSSLNGFRSYQRDSAWVWEHQALTRARFAAGDAQIGAAFEQERRAILSRERDLDALRKEVISMRERMHEGHPNRSELFDLKHDDGGMVDIEFIVQTLVLAHAHAHPELLENLGNIALLRRAGQAGLIDAQLAERVATAYRSFRQLQHTLRLNDVRYARVEPDSVQALRDDVKALWQAVLGDPPTQ